MSSTGDDLIDSFNRMIDPVQYGGGIPKMPDPTTRMTAREALAADFWNDGTAQGLINLKEKRMRMQDGEQITKPIPWYVIVWEEGAVHLESTIITTDRDMALLQAGAALADSIGEDVDLAKCQVSARPAV